MTPDYVSVMYNQEKYDNTDKNATTLLLYDIFMCCLVTYNKEVTENIVNLN